MSKVGIEAGEGIVRSDFVGGGGDRRGLVRLPLFLPFFIFGGIHFSQ